MITDLSRGTPLPEGKSKTFAYHAEEMLAHFAGIDRADLLKTIVALTIMDMRYGNKREERAACDLLNLVQSEAVKQLKASAADRREDGMNDARDIKIEMENGIDNGRDLP
jgi:hypothetical protein